ncbi:MAG TPA: carboxypeptidase regulatory-like domain-containing protein [Kofleriaceae bacterium]|nr:carboxypeptidase regulatory-like domain-containing protein [Kofleriaceae bacterium]
MSGIERVDLLLQRYRERMARSPAGTVSGKVHSLGEVPLGGVTVRIRDQTAVTNAAGYYSIADVPIGSHVVTFDHPLYVFTQRPVIVLPAQTPQIDSALLPRSTAHRLDAEIGGTITEGPLTLHFDPKDLAFRDGTPVHGEINVVVTVIDPRRPGHVFAAPARLEGIDASGAQVGLISFGMVEVELSQGTERVSVRPGQTVTASMNIDGLDDGFVPRDGRIPMWHHDTGLGLWVQERGVDAIVARRADGALVATAELPHFSAWNWDSANGATCTVLQVPSSTPISGLRVVSTTAAGVIDSTWTINAQCLPPRPTGTTCVGNSPSGYIAATTYFKYQARVGAMWCDLTVALGGAAGEKTILQGDDINDWLLRNGLTTVGTWCGTPVPGTGYITGTSTLSVPSSLPANRAALSVNTSSPSSCTNLIGGRTASLNDPGYLAMAMNALSADTASALNIDRDSKAEGADNCAANSSSGSDANQNGIGDSCELACNVPLTDPYSSWYDFDRDGVDDLCDNRYTTYNPSQYVPTFGDSW